MRNLHAVALALSALLLMGAGNAPALIQTDDYSTLVVPDNSPVKFASYDKGNLSASFEGSFVLTGKYELGFHGSPMPGHPDAGVYGFTFTVDPEIVATLPYWDRNPEGAKEIDFENFGDFLSAVVGPDNLARLHRGEIKSYSGRASVRVDRFWTAKPCGYPMFKVHFLEVVKPSPLLASASAVEPAYC